MEIPYGVVLKLFTNIAWGVIATRELWLLRHCHRYTSLLLAQSGHVTANRALVYH